jgi:RNA polymerase sigma factor (sigma-70 family)
VRRPDADDGGLLLAAASGDDRTFAEFYRRWLLARGWVTSRWHRRTATSSRVEELASLGDARRLDRQLAQLPLPHRVAVRARILDERSYAEIAGEMACSEAVVRQRVHRGLSRLRERLKET